MENNLAPIVLFTYRRIPKETIDSLLKNNLVEQSDLFIYSDGYKNDFDKEDVREVREYLKSIRGFKSITIKDASKNKGLANSIIDGITEVINKYNKVIVLEDDVIISTDFLEYMNESLNFFKQDKRIWSISGYVPKLNILKNHYNKDIFLFGRGTSWSWATWIDRWEIIDWNVQDWSYFKKSKNNIRNFNKCGNDLFRMLELQMIGKINSWAIRWDYNQFINNMYTIYPRCSKALNVGFDDEKASNTNGEKWDVFDVELCNNKLVIEDVIIDEKIFLEMKKLHNIGLYTQIGYFLKKHGGYKKVKQLLNKLKGN